MANNFIKFCTAALAGSIIGIAYERMPPASEWPSMLQTVSATTSNYPKIPQHFDNYSTSRKLIDLNPQSSAENFKHSSKFGLPSKDNLRIFNDFILSYDRRLRAPMWVIEHLTPEKLDDRGLTNRDDSKFQEDPAIHEYFRAKSSDFKGSGYDKGHMAAAGNHKNAQEDIDQTFALTNISPQYAALNQGPWERLESYVRWRAKRAKNLYVVSGPLYLPMEARDGNLYVTYRVIGRNQISVPTHYFKVFLVEEHEEKLSIEAFVMPNDNKLEKSAKLDEFRMSIDKLDSIERASGVIFFDQLARDKLYAPTKIDHRFKENHSRPKKDHPYLKKGRLLN